MYDVNIDDVQKKYPLIEETNEIVGVWEFWIENCPKKLKIKVLKIPNNPQFPYQGVANYSIQNLKPKTAYTQADPYRSLSLASTIQEALEQALEGFLRFYDPEKVQDTVFLLDEKW